MKNPFWLVSYFFLVSANGIVNKLKVVGGITWILFLASALWVIMKADDRKKVKFKKGG